MEVFTNFRYIINGAMAMDKTCNSLVWLAERAEERCFHGATVYPSRIMIQLIPSSIRRRQAK